MQQALGLLHAAVRKERRRLFMGRTTFHYTGEGNRAARLLHADALDLHAALAIGIFVGAIWAERSWGEYWGWDPKETWALITLMIYAIPLHTSTVSALRKPLRYHVFMTLAFLAIIMTYFGVNYFLGGMHSYA